MMGMSAEGNYVRILALTDCTAAIGSIFVRNGAHQYSEVFSGQLNVNRGCRRTEDVTLILAKLLRKNGRLDLGGGRNGSIAYG